MNTTSYPTPTITATPTTATPTTVRETGSDPMTDFWGEPIHVYTRQQAIEDGVLVDASSGDLAEVSRQHFGPTAHVAMTARLFALIERAVTNPRTWNDWKGVWHDVCWMSIVLPERRFKSDFIFTVWFRVIITGAGRQKKHLLKRVMTPDGQGGVEITFLFADED